MNVNLLSWSVAPHALRAGARLCLFREEPGRGADAAHLPPGYSAKLLSRIPVKNPGPSSLGALLGVRGLALVVVEDERPTRLPQRKYRRKGYATPVVPPGAAGLRVAGHRLDREAVAGTVCNPAG
jgi:hypothetical protein